jgi:hypothetical protein
VDVDVAYKIGKFYDHAYALVNGVAYSLHKITEDIPEGVNIQEEFTIQKKGDIRNVNFVFLIPKSAQNLGFQFFDYEYGHISLPVQGDMGDARGSVNLSPGALGTVKNDLVEISAYSVGIQNEYGDTAAPHGWDYAVIEISGKSLSGGNVRDILQIKPDEYCWVITDGGYFYYCRDASTSEDGFIRFTPEMYQYQELAFLVPSAARLSRLGFRIRNDVFQINLTKDTRPNIPEAKVSHTDGDVMDVEVFGWRKEDGWIILNLGIRSLVDSGIEIQRNQQFMMDVGRERIELDDEKTDSLYYRPPSPFIIPPETFIRFEIAFNTISIPDSFYFRGYESEATLKLPDRE